MGENNLLEYARLVNARGHMIGGRTGAMAALGADAIVASIRNTTVEELLITQIAMGFYTTTLSSVLSGVAFAAYKVTGFTASPTDGRATDPVPVRKRTAQHSALAGVEVELANTSGLTAGTPAAPTVADPWCYLVGNVSVVAGNVSYQGQATWEADKIPLALGENEGLMILNQSAVPTNLQVRLFLGVECHRPPKARE